MKLKQLERTAQLLDQVQAARSQGRLIPFAALAVFLVVAVSVRASDPTNFAVGFAILAVVEVILAVRFVYVRQATHEAALMIVSAFRALNEALPGDYQPGQFAPLTADWFGYHNAILEAWGYSPSAELEQEDTEGDSSEDDDLDRSNDYADYQMSPVAYKWSHFDARKYGDD